MRGRRKLRKKKIKGKLKEREKEQNLLTHGVSGYLTKSMERRNEFL